MQLKPGLKSKKTTPSKRGSLPPRAPGALQPEGMDLGTMGIPRDVAHGHQQSNFLWTSSNK